jgi:predicted adenine nucleotide alpha hydrolase (AANH) superfamily ATPase
MHICCAPCSTYPIPKLINEGKEVVGFFYNPNIHPYKEYKARLESVKKFAEIQKFEVIYKDEYLSSLKTYLKGALNAENRCEYCYTIRLIEAVKMAKQKNFDAFTTTLLTSPWQKHELIKQICEKLAAEHKIDFYYEDFRVGWKQSRLKARELNLYMQKYCGCIFSEAEREIAAHQKS